MGRPFPRSLRLAAIAVVPALLFAASAYAQPFTWSLPAGGETWTAGTTHTVEWSGGNAGWNVNVQVVQLVPYQIVGSVTLGSANDGYASWSIPAGLAPGSYQLYVEDVGASTWAYGPTFTIQAPPACQAGCSLISIAYPPYSEPPAGVCGQTAAEAQGYAQNIGVAELENACANGSVLDYSTVTIDVTLLPVGICWVGYSGSYVAEVSAVACCCGGATPTTRTGWGRLKTIYR